MNELAKTIAEKVLTPDPEVEARIQHGIELHRKGFGALRLLDRDGNPIERATIKLKQVRHEFHFGCNGFLYQQFPEKERNEGYEEAFKSLFNLLVMPFYWGDLEPEKGKPRYAKDSPNIYRRPALDGLLEFCEANDITPKAHVLCYHQFLPEWFPYDKASMALELERHFAEIAERYGDRIGIWDVTNEALGWNALNPKMRMPDGHIELAFELAQKYFPQTATLIHNEAGWTFPKKGDYGPLYLLLRYLKERNLGLKGIGLQNHMLMPPAEMVAGGWYIENCDPACHLFCLDQYAKLGLPINISEITITAHKDLGDGPAFQRLVAEKFYRTWFSHPAINGIIWWNLVDDTACNLPGWDENQYKGGLLNNDLSPKPVYEALHRLIKEEWTTKTTLDYEEGTSNKFHGFYGDYEVQVSSDKGTFDAKLKLSKGSTTPIVITHP